MLNILPQELLFSICDKWIEQARFEDQKQSSRDARKHFVKFTGKHQRLSLFCKYVAS